MGLFDKRKRGNIPVEVYGCAPKKFFDDEKPKRNENVKVYGVPNRKFFDNSEVLVYGTMPPDFDVEPIDIETEFLKNERISLYANPRLENVFLEATLNCNEHCKHCGSNCGDNHLSGALSDLEISSCFFGLMKDLEEQEGRSIDDLPFITVTGGEPLLRPDLPKLMSLINRWGFKWGMTTNATLITETVAKELAFAGLFSVSVSLDGLEESHNWFRESKNGYALAIEGIKNLVNAGIPHVMVTTVVHRRNIHELDQIKEVVKSLGCDMWRIINVDPIGRAKDNFEILLNGEDYKKILNYIVLNNSKELPIIYSCNYYLGDIYEKKVRPWNFFCEAGLKTAGIQYNGDVGACLDIERNSLTTLGNIRDRSLYDIWINEFKIFRSPKVLNSDKCRNCEFVEDCNGGGFHTWDFETNNPRICMLEELGLKDKNK